MATKQSELLSIFGAKVSADGKKVVITLVGGENDSKKFYTTCVKLNNQQKTHAKVDESGKSVLIKIPMLEERVELNENDELPF